MRRWWRVFWGAFRPDPAVGDSEPALARHDLALQVGHLRMDPVLIYPRTAESDPELNQRVQESWIDGQIMVAKSLVGEAIRSWVGVEMFIRCDDDEVAFELSNPGAPCLQLLVLTVELADGGLVYIRTYYDNGVEWGLEFERGGEPLVRASDSPGYRLRKLDELPTGPVSSATSRTNGTGNLAEVDLVVGGRFLRLVAGEIHPTWTEVLRFARNDESVLVFTSEGDYDSIEWMPPEPPRGDG